MEEELRRRTQNRDARGLFDDSDDDVQEDSSEYEAAKQEDIVNEIEKV